MARNGARANTPTLCPGAVLVFRGSTSRLLKPHRVLRIATGEGGVVREEGVPNATLPLGFRPWERKRVSRVRFSPLHPVLVIGSLNTAWAPGLSE